MTETTWQMFAACHPSQGHDPDLWFGGPDSDAIGHGNSEAVKARAREAKRIRNGCMVREACAAEGLRLNARGFIANADGIWGGLDERERRRALRVQPILRDICGTEKGYARHLEANEHPCMSCRWLWSQRAAKREARNAG